MSCGICLSKLKEPVSVPCGHVYCTDCLTGHISATSSDGFTSTCPSCRETFNMVRPEITCLPKKFHQYIVPSIRRVYIDTSRHENLRKKLSTSEARVAALEGDKERLMAECERHIAAAQAHRRGETDARQELRRNDARLVEMQEAVVDEREARLAAEDAMRAMKVKYDKMKRHCRAVEAARCVLHSPIFLGTYSFTYTMAGARARDESPSVVGKRTNSLIDLSVEDEAPISPKRLRVIRPIPRSRQSLDTPKNWRTSATTFNLDTSLPLGSPFHSQ
ncbi:RING-type domain-containing protein [Mycena sanguinolenta]|uniref:RING-type domain-containing protein n=1 Tax=Mycena sanguinolenta TaxID=230812 RepID=A0A8H6Z758_9AGAR|nr:RING-type domain-containing protein [Mycena sanguinolenta]